MPETETGCSSSSKPNAQNLNLPRDDEVRTLLLCDPPCLVNSEYTCTKCKEYCDTKDEEYCERTCVKCAAVHSVSTEILEPQKWPALQCHGGEKYFDKEKNKEVILRWCLGERTPVIKAQTLRLSNAPWVSGN
jgi:hypothetical protein